MRSPRVLLCRAQLARVTTTLLAVPAWEIEEYLSRLEEPTRCTPQELRSTIREIVPNAQQVISYRVPAFRVRGQTIAGCAAFKSHVSYLPFSGSVLPQLAAELERYSIPGALCASRSIAKRRNDERNSAQAPQR